MSSFESHSPLKQRQETFSLEQYKKEYSLFVDSEISKLTKQIQSKAVSLGTENSKITEKRIKALEQAQYSLKGIIEPSNELPNLYSREAMISYSRKNEIWAYKLHLALKSRGMLVWFDNQEQNATFEEEPEEEPEGSMTKGIPTGANYVGSITSGISENGNFVLLLTHDVLDKFDIVGGLEIPSALKKKCKIIVATVDDPVRGSILDRVTDMERESYHTGKHAVALGAIVKAFENSQTINLHAEDFDSQTVELGDKVIDVMPKTDPIKDTKVIDSTESDSIAYQKPETIVGAVKNMKDYPTPGQTVTEEQKYKNELEDNLIILQSQIDPKGLQDPNDRYYYKFSFGNYTDKNYTKYATLITSLQESGMGYWDFKEKDCYNESYFCLLPLTKEDILLQPSDFQERFSPLENQRQFWVLVEPGIYPVLDQQILELQKEIDTVDSEKQYSKWEALNMKLSFLKTISFKQGLETQDTDLKDPEGLASYLLMKRSLFKRGMNSIAA